MTQFPLSSRRLTLVLLFAVVAGTPPRVATAAAPADAAVWSWDLTSGFDSYRHTYALAIEDTTETISEYLVQAGLEGRSAYDADHLWRLRAEASTGTELSRERLELSYRRRDARRATRLRVQGRLWARQYRQSTDYRRSSDNVESRGDVTWLPWSGAGHEIGLLSWGTLSSYRTPSTLELNHRELGVGATARSRGWDGPHWAVTVRRAGRSYPDSSRIDRRVWGLASEGELGGSEKTWLRLHHHSEYRRVADEAARPHAWTHGLDLRSEARVGAGRVLLEARAERWDYSRESDVYLDSWRWDGFWGYGWGDPLATRWKIGLTAERLDTGASPETYTQFGARVGTEAYQGAVSGLVTLEYGRRAYDTDEELPSPVVSPVADDADFALYSDFNYWKIWLLGSWSITPRLRLEAMASYEPESHTEQADDASLGYANLRLVWRR